MSRLISFFLLCSNALTTSARGRQVRRPRNQPSLPRLRTVSCTLAVGLFLEASILPTRAADTALNPVTEAFEVPRDDAADTVLLRDGILLNGIVRNEFFTLRTSHGPLAFESRRLAGIDLANGPHQLDSILGVNGDRFSGFLDDAAFLIQLADGTRVSARRETVRRVAFHLRPGELDDLPHRQLFVLKSGDVFTGRLSGAPIRSLNGRGRRQARSGSDRIDRFPEVARAPARIALRDGSFVEATWPADDLEIELDLGPTVRIYRQRVAVIHCRDGQRPAGSPGTSNDGAPDLDAWNESAAPHLDTGPFEGMVWIAPGRFVMGSPTEEPGRDPDEGPQTQVTLTRGFWIAIHEVTQAEYALVMGTNPSQHTGDTRHPVERVNWREAMNYCARLTRLRESQETLPDGYAYRLPTEAEWEYACRAGTSSRFAHGDDLDERLIGDYAWFTENSESSTHPVGSRQPNPWGLYDVHGNVFEWCLDSATNSHPGGQVEDYRSPNSGLLRTARGGSWLYGAKASRSANRDCYGETTRCSDLGFRIVLAPPRSGGQ
jgi:formylglycine-generating enzyme required for sulfatase activity